MSQTVQDAPAPGSGLWSVLRHRHYRNVWIASFGSNVGNWLEMIAVQWAMAQATLAPEWTAAGRPGAPIMMGYLAVAQLAPTLALGLVGGVVADLVDRKKLLVWTQVGMMLIALALCIEAYRDALNPVVLLLLGLAHGLVLAFNLPAWGVLTPRLVPRAELAHAIMLNGLQFNMARVVGPALAGLLMGWFGAPVLFLINTVSFLGVIIAIASTPPAPPPPRDGSGPWRLIREAFAFSFRQRGPRALILAIFLFSMLATPLLRLLPIVVSEVYAADAGSFGLLLAMMGAGAVTGALTLRFVPRWYPRHHFIPLSVFAGGLTMGLTAASQTLWQAGLSIYLCGIFWMWTFNSAFAALQLLVDDRMRGRVMSITNVLSFGAMPIGTLIAGGIGEVISGKKGDGFGTQLGLGALAIALAVAGLVMLTWRTPEIDGLRPGDPGHERLPGLLRGITASAHRAPAARKPD